MRGGVILPRQLGLSHFVQANCAAFVGAHANVEPTGRRDMAAMLMVTVVDYFHNTAQTEGNAAEKPLPARDS